MLASITTENIGARTQILATTACPAHRDSPAHSPSAEVSNMPWPTNRYSRQAGQSRRGLSLVKQWTESVCVFSAQMYENSVLKEAMIR